MDLHACAVACTYTTCKFNTCKVKKINSKEYHYVQQDGSKGKCAFHQAWLSEFGSWDTHGDAHTKQRLRVKEMKMRVTMTFIPVRSSSVS